jgi:hypothetical protein
MAAAAAAHLLPGRDVELCVRSVRLQLRFYLVERHGVDGVNVLLLLLLQLQLQRLGQAAFAAGRGANQAEDEGVRLRHMRAARPLQL